MAKLKLTRAAAQAMWCLLRDTRPKGFKKIRAQGMLMTAVRENCTDQPKSAQLTFKDGEIEPSERQEALIDEITTATLANGVSGELASGVADIIGQFYTAEEQAAMEKEDKEELEEAKK